MDASGMLGKLKRKPAMLVALVGLTLSAGCVDPVARSFSSLEETYLVGTSSQMLKAYLSSHGYTEASLATRGLLFRGTWLVKDMVEKGMPLGGTCYYRDPPNLGGVYVACFSEDSERILTWIEAEKSTYM